LERKQWSSPAQGVSGAYLGTGSSAPESVAGVTWAAGIDRQSVVFGHIVAGWRMPISGETSQIRDLLVGGAERARRR